MPLSEYLTTTAGVPQGSVLGPLLFLIYVNDIDVNIESIMKLFADDTSLYLCLDNPCIRAEILKFRFRENIRLGNNMESSI